MKKQLFSFLVLSILSLQTYAQVYDPVLGGELSNSAVTSIADIDEVIPRMKSLGLNTVLVPAYWDLIEAEEGVFDFSTIDRVIDRARENDLKVIFLWFGAWKNSMSCYAPLWFKRDTKRFPRAMTRSGKPLEIASCFSDNVLQADLRAFTKFMERIAAKDRNDKIVTMIQIENEIGMLEEARDHSPLAEKAYKQQVPAKLLKTLKLNKKGTWTEVFGHDVYADEKFMAYHYACYVEHLAKQARQIYDVPLYVNAAMNSRGRKPGEYPSAGPLAHLIDFWRCGAPSIDFIAPDIYDTGFKDWVAKYALPNNPLFIPEIRCTFDAGVRALYTIGEYRALGFSPFAIDQAPEHVTGSITQSYRLVNQLVPLLNKHPQSWGLLFSQEDKERVIDDDGVCITARHFFTLPWDSRSSDGTTWPEGGGIIIRLAKYEYVVAGNGVVVEFHTQTERQQLEAKLLGEDGFADVGKQAGSRPNKLKKFTGRRLGLGYVDQVRVDKDGTLRYIRRDNGDQSHQGRHARISVGENKILHIKLYEY